MTRSTVLGIALTLGLVSAGYWLLPGSPPGRSPAVPGPIGDAGVAWGSAAVQSRSERFARAVWAHETRFGVTVERRAVWLPSRHSRPVWLVDCVAVDGSGEAHLLWDETSGRLLAAGVRSAQPPGRFAGLSGRGAARSAAHHLKAAGLGGHDGKPWQLVGPALRASGCWQTQWRAGDEIVSVMIRDGDGALQGLLSFPPR